MTKHYITFSGERYHNTTQQIVTNAPRYGAQNLWVYDDIWLKTCNDFCRRADWLFHHPRVRAVCWFAWKPFIMLDALSRVKDGDVVLFTDADTYPVADLNCIYNRCVSDGGIMLFDSVGWFQEQWCKKDCYILMGQDDPQYYHVKHGVARFYLFQKGANNIQHFLEEWLHYCLMKDAITHDPSVLGVERECFKEHRCEQAILTNLAHKYKYRLYREACQFGNSAGYDFDIFPQLFVQDGRYSSISHPGGGSAFRNVRNNVPQRNVR